jgi:hypothetical protein
LREPPARTAGIAASLHRGAGCHSGVSAPFFRESFTVLTGITQYRYTQHNVFNKVGEKGKIMSSIGQGVGRIKVALLASKVKVEYKYT